MLAMLGFGVQNYFNAIASRRLGGFRTSFWFQLLLLAMLLVMGIFLFTSSAIDTTLLVLIVFAALMSAMAVVSFNIGLQVGSIPVVATVSSAWGAVSALLGFIFLSEVITGFQFFCIGLIVIGTLFVSSSKKPGALRRPRKDSGMEYALLAALGWGVYFFLLRFLVTILGWFSAALLTILPGIFIMLAYSRVAKVDLSIKKSSLPILALIAVIDLVAFLSYNIGVSYSFAAIVAPISAAAPVVTITLAVIFMNEKLANHQKEGILLVITGLILLAL